MMGRPSAILEIIWIVWLCSWVAASFWSGRTQSWIGARDTWTYRAVMIVGGVLLVPITAHVLGEPQLWPIGYGAAYVLAAIMIAGLCFTWWGRIYLGRLWSSEITRKEGHHIVDTGPYGVVRHPIYTGLIVGLLATAVAEATVTGVIGAALVIFGIYLKASSEERFLRVELGPDAYDSYRRRVPMLIPFMKFS